MDAISEKRKGLTRAEILEKTKLDNNALFSKRLEELEKCSFIRHYEDYSKRQRNMLYQLVDPLSHFWCNVVEQNKHHDNKFSHSKHLLGYYNIFHSKSFHALFQKPLSPVRQNKDISRQFFYDLSGMNISHNRLLKVVVVFIFPPYGRIQTVPFPQEKAFPLI